jgi:DinB family protein
MKAWTMTNDERTALIRKYRDGYRVVQEALAGATAGELDARPAPNKWSAREIVHHLADSEMTAAIRLRRLIAEDGPVIHGYDQDEYARRLYYDRPIETSLQAVRFARESTAELLDRLQPAEWTRAGTHSEHGAYGVEQWLKIYSGHAHKHAEQITKARASA